jgi:hypothetical protein
MRLKDRLLGVLERRRARNWVLTVEAETPDGPVPLSRAIADLESRAGVRVRRFGAPREEN